MRIKIKNKKRVKTKKIVKIEHRYIATGTKGSKIAPKKARGLWFEDVDGNTMLDFTNGMILATGHLHPRVVKSIKEQLNYFTYFNGPDFYYEVQAKLAKKLTEITPGKFPKKVFFCNSGAEASEAAWKVVKWSRQRHLAIAFMGAFHGRTMGALSLTGSKAVHKNRFFPTTPGVTHLPYAYCYRCAYKMRYPECNLWCVDIIEKHYFRSILPPEQVGAIFVEPIQGEGGYVVPPKEFHHRLRKLTTKYGILLVEDEVQTGFGKTGKLFASEYFGVVPDIITMAKAMGGGLPIGAAVFNSKYDFKVSGAHSNTYGGNPIAAVATLSTINTIYKEGLLKNASKVGAYFKGHLLTLKKKYEIIGDVRGVGLMQVIELVKNRKTRAFAQKERDKVVDRAVDRGLLLLSCGVSGIRFTPALTVSKKEIDIAVSILDEAIRKVDR